MISGDLLALAGALPWALVPIITALRFRDSRSLDDVSPEAPADAPLISVIVPARNEARNVERCMRSILATTYPRVELIVVDDQSADGTGELAAAIARTDNRVLVFTTPPLPGDWFGKQWACWTGASKARGELLCFTDADTTHAPELLARSVNAMRARGADLLTVFSRQELGTFWERLIQPQIFTMLWAWYGGAETINRARRSWQKIASGQFMFFTRSSYYELGGHEAVRRTVAEDLMLAQLFFQRGKSAIVIEGEKHLSTRMYASLRELVAGWGKNVYAGGIHALPGGRAMRAIYPAFLLLPPSFGFVPPLILAIGLLLGWPNAVLLWAAIATSVTLIAWIGLYDRAYVSRAYAFLYPLGSAVTMYIFVRAAARGMRVTWKDRTYQSA